MFCKHNVWIWFQLDLLQGRSFTISFLLCKVMKLLIGSLDYIKSKEQPFASTTSTTICMKLEWFWFICPCVSNKLNAWWRANKSFFFSITFLNHFRILNRYLFPVQTFNNYFSIFGKNRPGESWYWKAFGPRTCLYDDSLFTCIEVSFLLISLFQNKIFKISKNLDTISNY